MASLYELTEDFKTILEMMQDPEMDPGMIEEAMRQVEGDFDTKAEGYCKVIKELEGKALVISNEIDRLSKLQKTAENNIANLKEILLRSMVATNKEKIDGELFKLTVKRCAPKVIIDNEEAIPDQFKSIVETVKIDKKAIGTYLKENPFDNTTAGAFAHLEEVKSLLIK